MTDGTYAGPPPGGKPAPARIRFGPGDTQTMPAEWAELMLTRWRADNAQQFGKMLAWAATEGANGNR